MEWFDRPGDLAEAIGLPLTPGPGPGPESFAVESDWGFQAAGHGRAGGVSCGGWLVTFARSDRDAVEGHLIGYEIGEGSGRTGRCVLIRSPWATDEDASELRHAFAEGWWRTGDHMNPTSLDTLHARLPRGRSRRLW